MAKLLKFLNQKMLFWGIAFLLFFIPLYPKFPLFSVSGTYVSVRLEDFFVAFLVFIYFLSLLLKRDFSLLKKKLTRLILLYFVAGLLSVASGFFITKNITLHIALLHFLRRIEYISLFFVCYSSFKNIAQLKTYGFVSLISTLGVIIYGLGQKFYSWPVVSTMNKEFSKGLILRLTWWARVNSTFAGHYDLAAYMVMIIALSIALFFMFKNKLVRLVIGSMTLLSYYLLVLTASRISFIAYLFSSLVVFVFVKKWKWIAPFVIFSVLGMFLSDDLGQRYAATFKVNLSFMSGLVQIKLPKKPTPTPSPEPTQLPIEKPTPSVILSITPTPTPTLVPTLTPTPVPTEEYFEPTQLAVGRSTDIRLKVEWPRALRAFIKNPLLGTGYSSITLATDNDYLRILGETGVLGTAAFVLVILEIFRRFLFFLKNKTAGKNEKMIVIGVLGASIGYFINACFIDVWEASKIAFFFWILIGIGLKTIDINKENKIR